MSLPVKGSQTGTSEKENLLQVFKQTGRLPKELAEQPRLPELFGHVWEWFTELHCSEVLEYSEIESWSRLTHRNVTASEVSILRKLSTLFWKIVHGRNRNTGHSGKG